jgi:glycosyltransferase involved in cell wall biosynthesis
MHRQRKITVVIPCYNEEHGLPRVLTKIPAEVDEVLVLDNCSTDRTAEVARGYPRVRVIQHPHNLGYGGSYIRGLPSAAGDILVTTDGDGTYPVEHCVPIIDQLLDRNLDFVSCSRFPLHDKRGMHPRNRFGNGLLTVLVNMFFGLGLKDGQSGMWIFRKSILPQMHLTATGMAFSNEIKLEAFTNPHIRAAEVPIHYFERTGESKLQPFRDGMRMVRYLATRRLNQVVGRRAPLPALPGPDASHDPAERRLPPRKLRAEELAPEAVALTDDGV